MFCWCLDTRGGFVTSGDYSDDAESAMVDDDSTS